MLLRYKALLSNSIISAGEAPMWSFGCCGSSSWLLTVKCHHLVYEASPSFRGGWLLPLPLYCRKVLWLQRTQFLEVSCLLMLVALPHCSRVHGEVLACSFVEISLSLSKQTRYSFSTINQTSRECAFLLLNPLLPFLIFRPSPHDHHPEPFPLPSC